MSADGRTLPSRILLIRLSSLGDTVCNLPVLCALRKRYPDARICWIAEDWVSDLLRGHEALDELITIPRNLSSPYPRHRFLGKIPDLWRLRGQLRLARFDTVVDLQGRTKSALPGWLTGAETRLGYAGSDAREQSRRLNNRFITPHSAHVIDRSLELLQYFGVTNPKIEFRVPIHSDALERIQQMLSSLSHDRYIVMNPGAGGASKIWRPEWFGEVARRLAERRQVEVLLNWAGKEELGLAERAAEHSRATARVLPRTSVAELAALLRSADLFIGSDTGPLHLAAALDTPCVGLYGPTDPGRTGPYGSQHEVVGRAPSTPPLPMEEIPVEATAAAALRILKNR